MVAKDQFKQFLQGYTEMLQYLELILEKKYAITSS